jgi:hypothetical protein
MESYYLGMYVLTDGLPYMFIDPLAYSQALLFSPLHELALYCWLFAPDSKTRRDSDLTRCDIYNADIMEGYGRAEEQFIKEFPPQKLRSQLDVIFKTQDATPKTAAFSMRFLRSILRAHPTSGNLGGDFGGDLADILWLLMRSGDSEDLYFAPRSACPLLKCVFKSVIHAHGLCSS